MSKFCGNCGAELADDVRVCGFCGTPCQEAENGDGRRKIPGTDYQHPEKKAAAAKKVKWVIAAGIFVAAVILICNVTLSFTGYHGLIRKVMKAFESYDINALLEVSSDIYFYGAEDMAEYYFENGVGNHLDEYEESVGHNYKISYEIEEIYTLSERKMKEQLEDISLMYQDFDASVIEEIKVAEIDVTAKQGKKSMSNKVMVMMSKESGEWRLLYLE